MTGRWDIYYTEKPRGRVTTDFLTIAYLKAIRRSNPAAYAELLQLVEESKVDPA